MPKVSQDMLESLFSSSSREYSVCLFYPDLLAFSLLTLLDTFFESYLHTTASFISKNRWSFPWWHSEKNPSLSWKSRNLENKANEIVNLMNTYKQACSKTHLTIHVLIIMVVCVCGERERERGYSSQSLKGGFSPAAFSKNDRICTITKSTMHTSIP